jgi:hypothetical protein
MGIKGFSSNVIKQVWRDGSLKDLPRGTRIGVDGAGWLHKSVIATFAWRRLARTGTAQCLSGTCSSSCMPAWRSWSSLMALVGR